MVPTNLQCSLKLPKIPNMIPPPSDDKRITTPPSCDAEIQMTTMREDFKAMIHVISGLRDLSHKMDKIDQNRDTFTTILPTIQELQGSNTSSLSLPPFHVPKLTIKKCLKNILTQQSCLHTPPHYSLFQVTNPKTNSCCTLYNQAQQMD